MRYFRTLGELAFALILCGAEMACSSPAPPPAVQVPPAVDPAAIEKQIRSMDADWSHAATLRDVEQCLSYYADDGMMLNPNEPIASGKEALRKSWTALINGPGYVSLTFGSTKVSVAQAGDMAYDVGTYELTTKDKTGKASIEAGKYVEVWQKQVDSSWKVALDIYNTGQ